ncbi:MAG: histidinol-phosphatase [Campylobacterota bacterium]|nr:histidinol-phosphatase [Campylobacterota bacterium]
MRVDLHNHTTLCNHAAGTIDEYILKAIDLGIDIYGFSEHAPMKSFEDGYRLTLNKKEFYEQSILNLKEKYKKDINIVLGYEVDFLSGDYILDDIKNAKVDYLIGSVHYLGNWGFDNPEFIGEYKNKDIDKIWEDYFEAVKQSANSGIFNIVGHLDLIKIFNFQPKKDIKSIALESLKTIKKNGLALEINSAGLRKPIKEQYPSKQLLELAFELDIPITFSSDAHSVEQIGFSYDEVTKIARDVGYTKAVYFEQKEKIEIEF